MTQEHYHIKHLAQLVSDRLGSANQRDVLALCDGVDKLFVYAKALEAKRAELESQLKERKP